MFLGSFFISCNFVFKGRNFLYSVALLNGKGKEGREGRERGEGKNVRVWNSEEPRETAEKKWGVSRAGRSRLPWPMASFVNTI